jgi:hypothetical protein
VRPGALSLSSNRLAAVAFCAGRYCFGSLLRRSKIGFARPRSKSNKGYLASFSRSLLPEPVGLRPVLGKKQSPKVSMARAPKKLDDLFHDMLAALTALLTALVLITWTTHHLASAFLVCNARIKPISAPDRDQPTSNL